MVELEALRHAQRQQDAAGGGQVGVLAEHGHGVAELLGEPAHAGVGLGHDGGEALVGGVERLPERVEVLLRVVEGADVGLDAGALDGCELALLVRVEQAAEQRGDLGGGAVACEQAALVDAVVAAAEDVGHLLERGGALRDGLVLVAQQQEVRATEEARQDHELGLRVVLDLVDHHEARGGLADAREQQAQPQPLGGRDGLVLMRP